MLPLWHLQDKWVVLITQESRQLGGGGHTSAPVKQIWHQLGMCKAQHHCSQIPRGEQQNQKGGGAVADDLTKAPGCRTKEEH